MRFIANQPDKEESREALALFSEIIRVRQYDTSRIMAILSDLANEGREMPSSHQQPYESQGNGIGTEGNHMAAGAATIRDLARLDCDRDTDFFMLKFLLCSSEGTESELRTNAASVTPNLEHEPAAQRVVKARESEEMTIVVTENEAAKKYAMTSYIKLLTQRVLRLEQEINRQKKLSVVVVGGGDARH